MSMRVIVVLCQKDAGSFRIWRYMQLPVDGYFETSREVVSVEPVVDDFDDVAVGWIYHDRYILFVADSCGFVH